MKFSKSTNEKIESLKMEMENHSTDETGTGTESEKHHVNQFMPETANEKKVYDLLGLLFSAGNDWLQDQNNKFDLSQIDEDVRLGLERGQVNTLRVSWFSLVKKYMPINEYELSEEIATMGYTGAILYQQYLILKELNEMNDNQQKESDNE